SDRERQIVKLVALGFTNAEIGADINLSGRTVETHRANILRKLELSSRSGLVRYAIDQGMLH
ncbi:MAG: DNA-binding response regulator, partial [Actinobacteria bacterium]|nr:DNA-binding response regulator [Actinomycetota bacterium]